MLDNKALLDIVIVNWNSGQFLKSCLESIERSSQEGFVLDRVVVVDNASTDGSVDQLEIINIPIEIKRNLNNLGFAAACNQGASISRADYLLFLNPDTEISQNTLTETIGFMNDPKNKHVGICGVRLVDETGEMTISCARLPTVRIFLGKITGLNRLWPKFFPSHFLSADELHQSRVVEQINGAFFLVRRSLFIELDGFDERFYVYFEEVDFSIRALKKGYLSYFLAHTSSYHKGGGSTDKIKSTRLFYSLGSRLLYGKKHFSKLSYLALVGLTLTVELFSRTVHSLSSRSTMKLSEVIEAYRKLVLSLVKRDPYLNRS